MLLHPPPEARLDMTHEDPLLKNLRDSGTQQKRWPIAPASEGPLVKITWDVTGGASRVHLPGLGQR